MSNEKPTTFYHGSPTRDLEELSPQGKSFRKLGEGVQLYACPDIAGATLFLETMYDEESRKGDIDGTYFFVIANKEKFLANDHGGTIYVLPDANFTCDPDEWQKEWTTKESVKPTHKIHSDSALRAMIENGVKVYFTDKETFEAKIKSRKWDSFDYLEKELGLVAEK
ncbi:MAG: hypothetical protein NTY66_00930 [Candidatus Vogelbacteria bacterium]|nr:hypothetical protein [Candidatus Vogelbacteria bacterium]